MLRTAGAAQAHAQSVRQRQRAVERTAAHELHALRVAHDLLLNVLGPVHTLAVPSNAAFTGLTVYIQGADLLAPGPCGPSLPFTLTDSFSFVVQ